MPYHAFQLDDRQGSDAHEAPSSFISRDFMCGRKQKSLIGLLFLLAAGVAFFSLRRSASLVVPVEVLDGAQPVEALRQARWALHAAKYSHHVSLADQELKTLILLRHANGEWDSFAASGNDFNRSLTSTGRIQAELMGKWLSSIGEFDTSLIPGLALVSAATRARETFNVVYNELSSAQRRQVTDIRVQTALYSAHEGQLLKAIQTQGGSSSTVLLVGHNPSLWHLAVHLTGSSEDDLKAQLKGSFPAASMAVLRFRCHKDRSGNTRDEEWWKQCSIKENGGRLQYLVSPEDVREALERKHPGGTPIDNPNLVNPAAGKKYGR